MIECTLMEIEKYSYLPSLNSKTKHGVYSSSIYHNIKGFGRKAWVVIVNIGLDYDKHGLVGEKTLEEVVLGCIEYLNTPLKSKYGKRRKRRLPYGKFQEEPYRTSLKEKDGQKYIQALLIIEDRKRRCFWGEGEKLSLKR